MDKIQREFTCLLVRVREFHLLDWGRPLGFFSSWPLFTLTHHTLVWIAAERVYGTTKLCDYARPDEKVSAAYHNK